MFGLRGKLGLALAAMTLSTVVSAAFVIYSVSRSTASFNQVATTTLPSLRVAERLTRHSERAVAQIAALSAAQSEDVRRQVHRQWEQIDQALSASLDQAEKLHIPSVDTESLAGHIGQLKTMRDRLDAAVRRRLMITAQQRTKRAALIEASAKFQDILEPLIAIAERERLVDGAAEAPDTTMNGAADLIEPAAGPGTDDKLVVLRQLRQMTSDIVNTLLAVEQENRLQHVQLAAIRTQSYADRVAGLLPMLDHDAGLYLAGLNEDILDEGSGPDGLPALRQEILANQRHMAALRTTASALIKELETVTDGMIRDASSAFDRDQQSYRQAQFQMSLLVVAAAALSILASLGIGTFYIQRRLVQPIVQLSGAIKSFERGGSVDSDFGQSRDEIGQLEKAFVDMTKRRQQAESELAERNQLLAATNAELERSNQELDSFAYIAAHDLKEPLRAIQNHAGFLKEDYGDQIGDDGAKRLDRLIELGQRTDKLIADLLYYARLGRGEEATEAIDPNGLIAEIEASLADTLKARHAEIVVKGELPIVTGNKAQIATVFRNLISNGSKYNDAEEKVVEIGVDQAARQDVPPDAATFFVRDNGIGIDDGLQEDVFKIFKRLHSRKTYGEGTGAGLSFVKKIVENQGGKIWLTSEPGDGTTFYFTLRRAA